jgi:hypothetical protein
MRQHIGVGQATVVKEIEIWWPVSGERQHFRNVAIDSAYHVKEGVEKLEPIHWKQFEIGKEKIAKPLEMTDMPGMK